MYPTCSPHVLLHPTSTYLLHVVHFVEPFSSSRLGFSICVDVFASHLEANPDIIADIRRLNKAIWYELSHLSHKFGLEG